MEENIIRKQILSLYNSFCEYYSKEEIDEIFKDNDFNLDNIDSFDTNQLISKFGTLVYIFIGEFGINFKEIYFILENIGVAKELIIDLFDF